VAQTLALGERQYERRFRSAMGLPPRTWLRVHRFESALVAMGAVAEGGDAPPAQLAVEAGYADQAHLTRAVSAGGGETPARLRAGMRAGRPGYWAFEPARVGFVQDGPERAG
jgi:transcriptional regulator GlxA family with amidase domain